eukprot:48443-Eustigmatos_ZCMA.PRE.1
MTPDSYCMLTPRARGRSDGRPPHFESCHTYSRASGAFAFPARLCEGHNTTAAHYAPCLVT